MRMNEFFKSSGEKVFTDLNATKSKIANLGLHASPCPLLDSQLTRLEVYAEDLIESIHKLKEIEK